MTTSSSQGRAGPGGIVFGIYKTCTIHRVCECVCERDCCSLLLKSSIISGSIKASQIDVLRLTNRFFCALVPLQTTTLHFFQPSYLSPLSPLSFFFFFPPLLPPPALVMLPWRCDDCVLYQSVTCVLAQPPPAPCTRSGVPCAAAAPTGRRAA